jgi:GntR family transcriptional regulator/MocR family aminotransferase
VDGPIPEIDRDTGRPLGVQLVEGLRRRILDGVLRPGDAVPSTRALAAELAVSRSAVVAAYEQLAGEGYLDMRQGAPTRVAALVLAGTAGGAATAGASSATALSSENSVTQAGGSSSATACSAA